MAAQLTAQPAFTAQPADFTAQSVVDTPPATAIPAEPTAGATRYDFILVSILMNFLFYTYRKNTKVHWFRATITWGLFEAFVLIPLCLLFFPEFTRAWLDSDERYFSR